MALLEGLKITEERNLLPIKINVDSAQVITMLQMETYTMIIYLCLQVCTEKDRESTSYALLLGVESCS